MSERVILADCCEDWIIDWGGFYETGASFACTECATEWKKSGTDSYRRADGRTFVRSERRGPSPAQGPLPLGPAARFAYLAATDGHEPRVDRCCTKILLAHGRSLHDGPFVCPVCRTRWERRTERLHGLRVPVFQKDGLAEPLAVQSGSTRPFLVAVSEYSPPRD